MPSSRNCVVVDYSAGVRWDALFADLEARLAAEDDMDRDLSAAELARAEAAALTLAERFLASIGHPVVLRTRSGAGVRGEVSGAGADVLLLRDGADLVVVPAAAVASVSGLARTGATARSARSRLGLRSVIRELAVAREPVRLLAGAREVRGIVHRVGADHLDIGVGAGVGDPAGVPEVIPLTAVETVRAG